MVERDSKGRPSIEYCPICGAEGPDGIWTTDTQAIVWCEDCGCDTYIDVKNAIQ